MERNNSAIKAVIFDIGNVLVFYNHHTAAKKMSKLINISESKIFDVLHGKYDEFPKAADLGASSDKYWEIAAKILKIKKISSAEFDRLWNTIFWPNERIFPLLKKLRRKYILATISNLGVGHKKYLLKKYNLKKLFDRMFLSCDLKMRKPYPEIYHFVIKKLKIMPHEAIYIDDKLENVKGARKIGIHAIHFKNNQQLSKKLKKFGIKY